MFKKKRDGENQKWKWKVELGETKTARRQKKMERLRYEDVEKQKQLYIKQRKG